MQQQSWPSDKRLKRINQGLLAIILISNMYVLLKPLLPKVDYEVKQRISKPVQVNPADENSIKNIDRTKNHLVLPSMQLDEPFYEGNSPSTVHKGIWHRPNTNTPDKGGNTVLVGHRFTYDGAAVFYNLDKLTVGDDAYLVHAKKIYHYKIITSAIVPPTATEVEAPSNETKLTLYTCTPLVTAKNRLVYTAKLEKIYD